MSRDRGVSPGLRVSGGGQSPVPILMYHSVDQRCAEPYRRWMITPAAFAEHMSLLSDLGYVPCTISQLAAQILSEGEVSPRCIAITFDDGLGDFITGALPILQRHAIPATLFVVSGRVGGAARWLQPLDEGNRPMLSWSQLRDIASAGIEIGGHSVTHPMLDIIPAAAARSEIFDCKAQIEDNISQPVTSFAYPYGYSTRLVRALVQEAGFSCACRVAHALSCTSENPYLFSRLIIAGDTTAKALSQLLAGHGVRVAPQPDRFSMTLWRTYRRMVTPGG